MDSQQQERRAPTSISLPFIINQWTSLPRPPTGPVLDGKTIIITGANGGIGYETALHFAACSPTLLILAVRNLNSGTEALEKILKKYPLAKVQVWELDISKYDSVKRFAARAEKELDHLDVLINNAGVNPGFIVKPLQKTQDRHEHTLQVNVLSTLLLSLLLLPLLRKSTDPRLTIVTSGVHVQSPTSLITDTVSKNGSILEAFDDEEQYINPVRYHESKMIIRKLIPALPDIITVAVTPGLCRTNLVRDRPPITFSLIHTIAWLIVTARSAEVGARNVTFASITATDSNEYWAECQPKSSSSSFLASGKGFQATDRLWNEVLEEMDRVVPGCTKGLKL